MDTPTAPPVPIAKRLFDLALTLPLLLVLSPVLLAIALVLWLSQGCPVIFSQERPGLGGQVFRIHKFRTMRAATGADGKPLPDGERITPVGRFLRAFSLDELPELFDVLRGKMSLVGPRPLLVKYLPLYSPEQARRHNVLPGITGWAQVNGRNALSWQQRFALDVWYVDNWSLRLDIRILFMTLGKVIRREGISQPGQATVEEFQGNAPDAS